ncbi:MAG: DUF6088 family protein [Pseudomonadota bacterium]
METIAKQVKRGIEANPGRFWQLQDFPKLSAGAVAHALSRLCHEGLIKRYGRGIYYHPRKTMLGDAPPPTFELVKLLARKRRVVRAGLSAFNKLGLTTQMPAIEIIATQAPIILPRVEVIHRDLERYGDASDDAIMVLDALGHLDDIPDTTPTEALYKLVDRFKQNYFTFTVNELSNIAMADRPKVRAMVGLLGDLTGKIATKERTKLERSINPLTKFKVSLAGIAPESLRAWHFG